MIAYKILHLTGASSKPSSSSPGLVLSNRKDGGTSAIMACSAVLNKEHRDLLYTRKFCEDQRGFFDHLHPKRFLRNSVRVVIMQSTTVITNYYSEQMKQDIEREERISSGEITRAEANREDEEWQEREWNQRIEGLPHRIMVAFAKYHSIVLIMRLYEHIASRFVDDETLDNLTIDTFDCAKRNAEVARKEGSEFAREMFQTCWRANMISFLADYSFHQIILAYGYYVYVQEQRRRLKQSGDGSESALHGGSLALSFLRKSTLLALNRGVGLGFSSLGGALGSVMWPGWGTLAGTNLGDSLANQITEDIDSPSL